MQRQKDAKKCQNLEFRHVGGMQILRCVGGKQRPSYVAVKVMMSHIARTSNTKTKGQKDKKMPS